MPSLVVVFGIIHTDVCHFSKTPVRTKNSKKSRKDVIHQRHFPGELMITKFHLLVEPLFFDPQSRQRLPHTKALRFRNILE